MIRMNQVGFDQEIAKFDKDMLDQHINYKKEPLKSCSGKAILERYADTTCTLNITLNLNNCIDGFDSLIDNLNALYTATSGYLHKASYNINLCEESNKSLT